MNNKKGYITGLDDDTNPQEYLSLDRNDYKHFEDVGIKHDACGGIFTVRIYMSEHGNMCEDSYCPKCGETLSAVELRWLFDEAKEKRRDI